ncbi:unnamed protein product [Cyclocybe aegerita]|uniref:Armadillo repeat-containing protein 8 n=1 Tax=Cyclocybe aegerita TaxID=1973307 RepID=A0A8S0VUM0_CYCAE|nr:unnamed protein product [Cyclocybe aegerita]
MTILTFSVASLKKTKNIVIGNPLAKVQIVQDELFVSTLIDCLNPPNSDVPPSPSSKSAQDALRIEAAHVVASLSYGSEEALGILLRANTHHALLYAVSRFTKADGVGLRAAFSRALRTLASSLAEVVGPSLWGLRPETSMIRSEAQQALDQIFLIESLDIYLPLLVPGTTSSHSPISSTAISISTAQMLANTIRTPAHRRTVTEWLPPADRQREVKSRRGWEKTATLSGTVPPPWVVRQLLVLLGGGENEQDAKLVEAVLSALAALARENAVVANFLVKGPSERDYVLPLAQILAYTKSRSVDVQLAACLCITHTLRASAHYSNHYPPLSPLRPSMSSSANFADSFTHGSMYSAGASLEDVCMRTVMNVVNRLIAPPPPFDLASTSAVLMGGMGGGGSAESPVVKTRGCFVLHYLVADDAALCHAALDRGCLEHLSTLIHALIPSSVSSLFQEEDCTPAPLSALLEAALTALASLALSSDDVRRRLTDDLGLLPCISRALRTKAPTGVGVRYAACQCVRAVSRAVAVLRTGVVDSGLGMDVLRIVLGKELDGSAKDREREEEEEGMKMDVENGLGEDRRVLCAALSAVCNIVNDFSPLRPIYLEEKLMPRLVYILRESGDPALRLNALWAVKNLVRKTSTETKRDIMSHLGWPELLDLLSDADEEIQEQAFNLVRNLAENEEGIAMVYREIGPHVLGKLVDGMRSAFSAPSLPSYPSESTSLSPYPSTSRADVALQATYALANLANGTHEQQDLMLRYPGLLPALQACLAESTAAVRRPALACVLVLAKANPRRRKEMAEVGIVGTLKRLCEWSGSGSGGGHHPYGAGSSGAGTSFSPTSATRGTAGAGSGVPWPGRPSARSPSVGTAGGGGVCTAAGRRVGRCTITTMVINRIRSRPLRMRVLLVMDMGMRRVDFRCRLITIWGWSAKHAMLWNGWNMERRMRLNVER